MTRFLPGFFTGVLPNNIAFEPTRYKYYHSASTFVYNMVGMRGESGDLDEDEVVDDETTFTWR